MSFSASSSSIALQTSPAHSLSSNRSQLVMHRLGHMRSSFEVFFFPKNKKHQMDIDLSLPLMIAGIACLALAIIGRLSKKIQNASCYVIGSIGVLLINGSLFGGYGWVASASGLLTLVAVAGFVDACVCGRVTFDMGQFLGALLRPR